MYFVLATVYTLWKEQVEVFYSVQFAAAAWPRGHARAPVRQQPQSHGPGHRGERRKAASTPPAPRRPAVFASPFPPACLQMSRNQQSFTAGQKKKNLCCSCVVTPSLLARLPWSFLQSTISTCASRCSLALAHRARDRALFPLPCGEAATFVMMFLPAQRVKQLSKDSPWLRWWGGRLLGGPAHLHPALWRGGSLGGCVRWSWTPPGSARRRPWWWDKEVSDFSLSDSMSSISPVFAIIPSTDPSEASEGSSGLSPSSAGSVSEAASSSLSTCRCQIRTLDFWYIHTDDGKKLTFSFFLLPVCPSSG